MRLGDQRAILGFHADLVEDSELNPLPRQAFHRLFHGIQLQHILICHNAYSLRSHVGKVHADLLCRSRAKADAGGGHFEGVLFLTRGVRGGGHMAAHMVGECGRAVVMMVIGIRMTGT